MAGAILRIERLRCEEPQDDLTDEVKMQHNGRQVWPDTGNAHFSMSRGNEVPVFLDLPFGNSETTRITLFDQEDVGTDDNLGSTDFHESEANTGVHTRQIVGPGSVYVLTYRIGKIQF